MGSTLTIGFDGCEYPCPLTSGGNHSLHHSFPKSEHDFLTVMALLFTEGGLFCQFSLQNLGTLNTVTFWVLTWCVMSRYYILIVAWYIIVYILVDSTNKKIQKETREWKAEKRLGLWLYSMRPVEPVRLFYLYVMKWVTNPFKLTLELWALPCGRVYTKHHINRLFIC